MEKLHELIESFFKFLGIFFMVLIYLSIFLIIIYLFYLYLAPNRYLFFYVLLPLTIWLVFIFMVKKIEEYQERMITDIAIRKLKKRISDGLILIPKDPEGAAIILDKDILSDSLIKNALIESKDLRLIRKVIEIHLNSDSSFIDLLVNMGITEEEIAEIQSTKGVKGDFIALKWLDTNFSDNVSKVVLQKENEYLERARITESKGDFKTFNTIINILSKSGNAEFDYKYLYHAEVSHMEEGELFAPSPPPTVWQHRIIEVVDKKAYWEKVPYKSS